MEQKIGLFPALSPEERREVEDYVSRHAHLRDAFEAVLRLDRGLQQGRALRENPPGDEALAYLAVMHDVDVARMPPVLRDALRDIERRIDADAELRARYGALRRRRTELEAASDVDAQLRRLMPGPQPGSAVSPHRDADDGRVVGRGASDRSGRHRLRRLAWAGLALAAAYALLFVGGQVLRPEAARLASFDSPELVPDGYDAVRGPAREGEPSSQEERYLEALSHLREAETTFLGLFPRYDSDRLEAADALLREVLSEEPEESFLAGEVLYLLGKSQLARGNVQEARDLLTRVAGTGGYRSEDADRLLRALDG